MARLLVVDDDAEQLDLRCLILRTAGHEVLRAQSAAAARLSFEARRPEVVVMDLRLPQLEDGMGLLRDFGPGARIIVLTGVHLDDAPPGVARVLQKPCSPRVLLRTIAELA